jgi:uncharacterized cupin superfamily protein
MATRAGVDIRAELARKSFLPDRTPHTTPEEEAGTFAMLAPYRDGAIYVGAFAGTSSWERHPNGDEIVQVIDGLLELTILDGRQDALRLVSGMLAVVPRGYWHRLHAPDGSTLLTVTPLPTETSVDWPAAEDER